MLGDRMQDANAYYKRYHNWLGDSAYTLERNGKDYSRVAFLKEFIEEQTPDKGQCLDIGCGDLYLSKLMPQFSWHGVDIAPPKHDPRIQEWDLMQKPYPYATGSFDTIVCSEVLEHLWDLRIVHREAHRMLKPGGTYVISTPNFDHIDYLLTRHRELLFDAVKPHLFEHIRQYNYEVHKKYLEECGFKVVFHCGADAQYTHFMQTARNVLLEHFAKIGHAHTLQQVDQVLGLCFPDFSHTVILLAKRV